MLTPEQLKLREGKLTASFLPYLMAGDERRIHAEWRAQVGDPEHEPEDFSGNWPVQFGSYVEDFVISWHEQKTGQSLSRRGEVVNHPILPFFCCTLDCWRAVDNCVLDCKVIGAYRKIDEVCSFYLPQIIGQRDCVGASGAGLLIVHGGAEPQEFLLDIPEDYCRAMWDRVKWFWSYVETLTCPVEIPPVEPPVIPTKTLDMSDSNTWSTYSAVWLQHHSAAALFRGAADELKKLIPADVLIAHGKGITAKRDKASRITIRKTANV